MLILDHADVERLLTLPLCIEAMRSAMRQVSRGETVLPLRQFMAIPERDGKMGLMPGYIAHPPRFGVKVVSKFVGAAKSHVGAVMLFDAETGTALALIEGGSLTAIRTAAASALATDLLARADATRLLVCGAGEQARWHIRALREVRPLSRVTVWARDPAKARAFAESEGIAAAADLERAAAAADMVCTTTSAAEPYLKGAWLRPGQHLIVVGSAIPTTAEVDVEAVARSRFFVDYRTAALAQAGELRRAIEAGVVGEEHIAAEIGAVLDGAAGRTTDTDITLYKSLGVTAQDLVAADALVEAANAAGAGQRVSF
jgi:ornithine cyclodeaminase